MRIKSNGINFICMVTISMALFSGCSGKRYADPKSPNEEIASFELEDGFQIRNVASEPLISMPVSMTIDEDGNTYVVELRDYPSHQDPKNGKSTIKMLFDTNGDGIYDKAEVFVAHIPDVTSILPYRGGLLVAAAPNILYLKDTNGDHKADIMDTLFTGFFTNNSEAQISNLTYGVDNWIYANNTGQSGQVKFKKGSDTSMLAMDGHDFRFRLDKGKFEAESGTGQFGLAIDDWNHRFYTQNDLHIQTNPIAWRYLARHEFMPSYHADYNVSDHETEMFQLTPAPYWRKIRTERRQRQYDSLKLNQIEWATGHFTGSSGGTFYGGDAFPSGFYGSIFTGEVAGNLVHRDILSKPLNNISYVASRGEKEIDREFLASKDPWFRPTSFYSGPDGNLFIVDMYRQHIETPVAIPEDLKKDMDFTAGDDMGRIYLVSVKGTENKIVKPHMSVMKSTELASLLTHPNAWWRVQAQRLLIERQDKSVVPIVRAILYNNKDARFRLRALYTLEGLNELLAEDVKRAMIDQEARVREQAVILSERFPVLQGELSRMLQDPASSVAFQAVLSIGNEPPVIALPLLVSALNNHSSDSLYNIAILSSLPGASLAFLESLKKQGGYFNKPEKYKLQFVKTAGFIFAARNKPNDITNCLHFFTDTIFSKNKNWVLSVLQGLSDGLQSKDNNKLPKDAIIGLKSLQAANNGEIKVAVTNLLNTQTN